MSAQNFKFLMPFEAMTSFLDKRFFPPYIMRVEKSKHSFLSKSDEYT